MLKLIKKTIIFLIIILSITACESNEQKIAKTSIDKTTTNTPINVNSSEIKKEDQVSQVKKAIPIDVDLTKLSGTMVYSEVYQMIWHPERYVGKIVKMNGKVSIFTSEELKRTYYTCVIADATACCQQGIEFRLEGEKALPSKYESGNDVTVVGEFSTYDENGITYCELINAQLL